MKFVARLRESFSGRQARVSSSIYPNVSIFIKLLSFLFARNRSDYYQYLADMIEGSGGAINFKDLFSNDAERYKGKVRGALSKHWGKRFNEFGGNFRGTFYGTLPDEDVELLNSLQKDGGQGAVQEGLKDLARNNLIVAQARATMIVTLLASVVAVGICLATSFVMPAYTVPTIQKSFSFLPAEYYPSTAQDLFGYAEFVDSQWLTILMVIIGLAIFCVWSFPNLTGPLRRGFERYGLIWGIYRDFQSVKFVTSLASMTKQRGNVTSGLQDAIEMQLSGASRWKRKHVEEILQMVKRGNATSDIFSTGIMDEEMYYYLDDLIRSRGFNSALQYVRERMETRILKKITVRCIILSWTLMLGSIMTLAYMMLMHMRVMEDMRSALQTFMS